MNKQVCESQEFCWLVGDQRLILYNKMLINYLKIKPFDLDFFSHICGQTLQRFSLFLKKKLKNIFPTVNRSFSLKQVVIPG